VLALGVAVVPSAAVIASGSGPADARSAPQPAAATSHPLRIASASSSGTSGTSKKDHLHQQGTAAEIISIIGAVILLSLILVLVWFSARRRLPPEGFRGREPPDRRRGLFG
jgi:hypothetical protein